MSGAVPVELGDGFEEVEEIGAVRLVQGCDEAGVDEDELRAVAFVVDVLKLLFPCGGVVAVRAKLLEDLFRDVCGVFGGGGFLVSA